MLALTKLSLATDFQRPADHLRVPNGLIDRGPPAGDLRKPQHVLVLVKAEGTHVPAITSRAVARVAGVNDQICRSMTSRGTTQRPHGHS